VHSSMESPKRNCSLKSRMVLALNSPPVMVSSYNVPFMACNSCLGTSIGISRTSLC
jgi:hypothetical protein